MKASIEKNNIILEPESGLDTFNLGKVSSVLNETTVEVDNANNVKSIKAPIKYFINLILKSMK